MIILHSFNCQIFVLFNLKIPKCNNGAQLQLIDIRIIIITILINIINNDNIKFISISSRNDNAAQLQLSDICDV